MDFISLFCELGNRPPIPAYPISLRLRAFAVNELRFLFIEAAGYRVVRFWNNEVLENTEGILERIRAELLASPSPQPYPQRGEGD